MEQMFSTTDFNSSVFKENPLIEASKSMVERFFIPTMALISIPPLIIKLFLYLESERRSKNRSVI